MKLTNKILIDCIYLNSPGGLNICKFLLDSIIKMKIDSNFEILLDNRNFNLFKYYEITKTKISKTEFSRYFFYKRNNEKFKSVLCLANVPPPIKIRSNINIYFHNEILLNTKSLQFSIFKKLLYYLKWNYIKSLNFNYTWIVQTEHIKEQLSKSLDVSPEKILKYPLFDNHKKRKHEKIQNSFIYPTNNQPHKNNEILINAFKKAASKTNEKIILYITINKIEIDNVPQNLEINFIGIIAHEELMNYLKNIKFLIFPSLRESFGLPLIEGVQSNCIMITSNLNFVDELITASYIFDPHSEKSITDVILLALSNIKHPKSSIKIEDSTSLMFNRLFNV